MRLKTVKKAPLEKGVRVLVRADFDVSSSGARVGDDFRIKAALPTVRFLLKKGARVRLIAHRGRPEGTRVAALSMQPVAARLSSLLGRPVRIVKDPSDRATWKWLGSSDDILLFENLRYWHGEEKNSVSFARGLARWGDIYVNDAFADCHRRHASIAALARMLPAYAGLRLEEEVAALEKILKNPARPFVAVLGGAKIETKLPLVKRFAARADGVLVGGAIANVLLKKLPQSDRVHLPVDGVAGRSPRGAARKSAVKGLMPRETLFDIGPETVEHFSKMISRARTVVWNGPMGLAEQPRFSEGTKKIARVVARVKGFTVVGGVDTVATLHRYKALRGFDHVSTGGGAMLEFLSEKKLPGLEALKEK